LTGFSESSNIILENIHNRDEMQNNPSRSNIKSISKAVRVLKALSAGNNKLSDIAREVKISKNGVFRLLYSLKQEELVVQDPVTREYYMGTLLFELSAKPLVSHQRLINCAYLEIEDLRRIVGETIYLEAKFGLDKIILRQLAGTHNLTFVGRTNPVEALWLGASGKVLLSQLNENELDMILDNITLTPATSSSITDKTVFKQEIAKVRERGFATSFNETEMGVAGIAAPISDYVVPVSLAIIGPEDRLAPKTLEYVEELKKKVARISRDLKLSWK